MVVATFLVLLTQNVNAQSDSKTVVGFYPFGYAKNVKQIYPQTINGHISERMTCFTDIELKDKSVAVDIVQAHEDAKGWMSALSKSIEQGYIKNASKLVTGFIINADEKYLKESKTFTTSILMQVHIVDVKTGVSEVSKQFNFNGSNPIGLLPSEKLPVDEILAMIGVTGINKTIKNAFKSLDKNLNPFLEKSFGRNNCSTTKDGVFIPVAVDSENTILIKVKERKKTWIKNLTAFDFLEDEAITSPDGSILGYKSNVVATGRFAGYTGDFAVIKLTKKFKNKASEIMASMSQGKNIYIKKKQKGQA